MTDRLAWYIMAAALWLCGVFGNYLSVTVDIRCLCLLGGWATLVIGWRWPKQYR